tara:strand:- start:139 stop:348 length:210 start_codon:yes stop_codon:yes gene_type:complete
MPYVIYKFDLNKYRVGIEDDGTMSNGQKYLTTRLLTRRDAIKQLYAVSYREFGKKPEIKIDKRFFEKKN